MKTKQTKLIEFKNRHNETLRGILTFSRYSNPQIVVMMAGFERAATGEQKFKALADALVAHDIPSFRFDHTGIGLSDGDFSKINTAGLGDELVRAVRAAKKKLSFESVSYFAHSLPPCIMADEKKRNLFKKIILMSPALNQRGLLRYWFTQKDMKKVRPQTKINWNNYKKYLNEDAFLEYCRQAQKMTKAHYVGSEYFLENSRQDYSSLISDSENILHIHGEKDEVVPIASLNVKFKNKIIVPEGDHDLERPDLLSLWLTPTVNFLKNN